MTTTTKYHATSEQTRERLSELVDLLANQRRRYAVRALYKYRTPMALADLTDEIVRREMNTHPTDVPDVWYQLYVQLYHIHLPKLAEADVVHLDLNENLVDLAPQAELLKPHLDCADFEEETSCQRPILVHLLSTDRARFAPRIAHSD